MSNQRVIWQVILADHRQLSGNTIHRRNGEKLAPPNQLQIVQLPSDPGFYLLYLDDSGNELTDTYHNTEEDAMDQAKFEFGLSRNDWIAMTIN